MRYGLFLLALITAEVSARDDAALQAFFPESCQHGGQFEQTRQSGSLTLESQGAFLYDCEKGLLWLTQGPVREAILYPLKGDPQRIDLQAQSSALDNRLQHALGRLLNQLIGGDTRALSHQFELHTEASDQSELLHLTLTPRSRRMQKFIRVMQIQQQPATVDVHLQMVETGSLALTLDGLQRFDRVSVAQCMSVLNDDAACSRWLQLDAR